MTTVYIGFWYNKHHPEFPKVVEGEYKNSTISKNLKRVEGMARATMYRGISTCRLCGIANGNVEFEYIRGGETYVWPEGLHHYLLKHGIKPPEGLAKLVRFTKPPDLREVLKDVKAGRHRG
jgi:hypothetical protein